MPRGTRLVPHSTSRVAAVQAAYGPLLQRSAAYPLLPLCSGSCTGVSPINETLFVTSHISLLLQHTIAVSVSCATRSMCATRNVISSYNFLFFHPADTFEPCCIHTPTCRPFNLLLLDCCSCTLFVLPDATSLLSRVYLHRSVHALSHV